MSAKRSKKQRQRAGAGEEEEESESASGDARDEDGGGGAAAVDDVLPRLRTRATDAMAALEDRLKQLRTGIAHPGLITHIEVECYGTRAPMQDVAAVSVSGQRMLSVNVFDQSIVKVRRIACARAREKPVSGTGRRSHVRVPCRRMSSRPS